MGSEGEVVSFDRLSSADSTFLHIEDGVSHMHVGSIGIFEGPAPGYGALLDMIASKLDGVPRYRQTVRSVPFNLGRPVWVDDPHFHLEYHVRQTALGSPGGEAELRRLVGRLMSQQLDRTKPLWELWFVEGLEDDHWALVSKTHHAMVDGVAATELLSILFDTSPDAVVVEAEPWHPSAQPSPLELATTAMAETMRSPYEQFRALRSSTRISRQAWSQAADLTRGFVALAGTLQPPAVSSLNGPIGPHRRYSWASTSVDDVRKVRKAFGGSFNDVVLAATAGAFRQLLLSRGESVERPVRSLVPVSVRTRDTSGRAIGDGTLANKVSGMFADLPVGIEDPVERLAAVTSQMNYLKSSHEAVAAEALTSLGGFTPPAVLALGARVASKAPQRSYNTVTTNVPGPQQPLFVLGRQMLKVFPYVPLGGQVRLGVAIFSYNGQVNFGVTGDYDTTPDIDVFCHGLEDTMTAMVKVATASKA
jgi:WS/DGAT/MGAT family acyltransferase